MRRSVTVHDRLGSSHDRIDYFTCASAITALVLPDRGIDQRARSKNVAIADATTSIWPINATRWGSHKPNNATATPLQSTPQHH